MVRVILAAAAVVALTMPALAADPMANYYGNTLVGKSERGEMHMWYKADNTYTSTFNDRPSAGTWAAEGDKVCLTQTVPPAPAGTPPRCFPMAAHTVGDTWTAPTQNGDTMSMTLVAGHQ
jgi:hypothetical protein